MLNKAFTIPPSVKDMTTVPLYGRFHPTYYLSNKIKNIINLDDCYYLLREFDGFLSRQMYVAEIFENGDDTYRLLNRYVARLHALMILAGIKECLIFEGVPIVSHYLNEMRQEFRYYNVDDEYKKKTGVKTAFTLSDYKRVSFTRKVLKEKFVHLSHSFWIYRNISSGALRKTLINISIK